jgi:glycosyltransferase involved in cell wall biosynthesis
MSALEMVNCSIILCTRNRAAHLRKTLAALTKVAVPGDWQVEVIVVDNASSDDTANAVSQARYQNMAVCCVHESRGGQCYARNTGIAAAKGEIIVYTDDDVEPIADWLEALCSPIVEGKADAVAGVVVLAPDLLRPWMTRMHRSWLASTEYDPATPPRMVGANMAFSRRVLERVPCFDTELGPGRLGFGDDTLFGQQLIAAGYRVVVVPDAVVQHHFDPDRLTRASLLATARKHGQTEAYLDRHWRHRVERWPRLKAVWAGIRLMLWRARRPGEWFRKEGAAAAEMYYVLNLYRLRHYILESRRPGLYEPGGLVKRVPTGGRD